LIAGLRPFGWHFRIQPPATRAHHLLLLNSLVDSDNQYHKELTVRHPRIVIASISLAAAAAIGGGITAAAATTSHAGSRPAASQQAAATVRTMQATVGGKTETILVNGQGGATVRRRRNWSLGVPGCGEITIGIQQILGRPGAGTLPATLRNQSSSRAACTLPPICAGVGSMPITTLAVQIWAFCAP
jgi:hypothetical protein